MMRQTLSASPLTFRRSLLVAGPGSSLTLEPSEPPKTRIIAPTTLVYWTRLGFAVLAGDVYTALGLHGTAVVQGTASASSFATGIYPISVFLVKDVLRSGPWAVNALH